MPPPSSPVPIDVLVAHQGFVRALARQLVRDPHTADDVAQATWLEASRAKQSVRSLRGWLAEIVRTRASNVRRAKARRTTRERAASRPEATEAIDLAERVELEQRVVRAVLALKEPYRGVILGRYYEGATTRELSARQRVEESTVRSQEVRALDLLRKELDATFDGGRATWCALLAPIACKETSVAPLVLAACACLFAAVIAFTPPSWRASFGASAVSTGVPPDADERETSLSQSAAAHAENAPPSAAPANDAPFGPSSAELGALTTPDLLRLALQTQATLREKLLAPETAVIEPYAERIARGDLAAGRILEADMFGLFGKHDLLGVQQGGSTYTFDAHTNDERFGDMRLAQGRFLSNTWHGWVVDLGTCAIDDVPRSADVVLPSWDETTRSAWALAWRSSELDERMPSREFQTRSQPFRAGASKPGGADEWGHTFLVRSVQPEIRDASYVFQSVHQDAYGHTFVWRKLAEWPVAGEQPSEAGWPDAATMLAGPAPAWLAAGKPVALLAFLARVREVAGARITAVSPALAVEYTPPPGSARGGVAKLVAEGPLRVLVDERRGASFVPLLAPPKGEDLTAGGMIQFANGCFSTGTASGAGWILDVGDVPLATLSAAGDVPASCAPQTRVAWTFLWFTEPDGPAPRFRAFTDDTASRARQLGLSARVGVRTGHTYLLRSVGWRSHDVTVAARVVARDEYGFVVAWRVLRELPAPGSPR